jgi:hypothetical protein
VVGPLPLPLPRTGCLASARVEGWRKAQSPCRISGKRFEAQLVITSRTNRILFNITQGGGWEKTETWCRSVFTKSQLSVLHSSRGGCELIAVLGRKT